MIELLLEAERTLDLGRVERAEALYRQVAEADPRSSIAVVGLARVAQGRGDDLGAYLLARRALIIDPENAAARRLAVRLEETLARRGEPVADPVPDAMPALAGPAPGPTKGSGPETGAADPVPEPSAGPRRRSLLDKLRRR